MIGDFLFRFDTLPILPHFTAAAEAVEAVAVAVAAAAAAAAAEAEAEEAEAEAEEAEAEAEEVAAEEEAAVVVVAVVAEEEVEVAAEGGSSRISIRACLEDYPLAHPTPFEQFWTRLNLVTPRGYGRPYFFGPLIAL